MSKGYSGWDGTVFAGAKDCDVQGWDAEHAVETWDSTTTADQGWADSSAGVQKLTGTFNFLYNPDKPPTFAADATPVAGLGIRAKSVVALKLYVNKADDVYLSGNALITKLAFKCAVKGGVLMTATFENKGPWELPGDEEEEEGGGGA